MNQSQILESNASESSPSVTGLETESCYAIQAGLELTSESGWSRTCNYHLASLFQVLGATSLHEGFKEHPNANHNTTKSNGESVKLKMFRHRKMSSFFFFFREKWVGKSLLEKRKIYHWTFKLMLISHWRTKWSRTESKSSMNTWQQEVKLHAKGNMEPWNGIKLQLIDPNSTL